MISDTIYLIIVASASRKLADFLSVISKDGAAASRISPYRTASPLDRAD
jgi:hypothetical protein